MEEQARHRHCQNAENRESFLDAAGRGTFERGDRGRMCGSPARVPGIRMPNSAPVGGGRGRASHDMASKASRIAVWEVEVSFELLFRAAILYLKQ